MILLRTDTRAAGNNLGFLKRVHRYVCMPMRMCICVFQWYIFSIHTVKNLPAVQETWV